MRKSRSKRGPRYIHPARNIAREARMYRQKVAGVTYVEIGRVEGLSPTRVAHLVERYRREFWPETCIEFPPELA